MVQLFTTFYDCYKLENIKITLRFVVDHGYDSKHQCVTSLKDEKWIQLIIKAMKHVFKINDKNWYPFDDEKDLPQEISLVDRVSITLDPPPKKLFDVIRSSCLKIKLVTK